MPKRFIVLSGPIASGKTALGDTMMRRFGLRRFKTREHLKQLFPETEVERAALQKAGERLDKRTRGKWIADALSREYGGDDDRDVDVIVDAVRLESQVEAIRKSFGPPGVVHVHLTAPPEVLARRYAKRKGDVRELKSYEQTKKDPTEAGVESLRRVADIVIDTNRCTPDDVVTRVASHLGLYGRGVQRLVDVLVGGQYGSEGKGQVSAYLAREYDVLVRVGGPNAGHKVYEEPQPYTHHLLPSGTRNSNALLVIGPGAMLWLPTLLKEISECNVSSERLFIDPTCVMIHERDRDREGKLRQSIGSTAQGVGYATARKVLRGALRPVVQFAKDVPELLSFIKETRLVLEDAFSRGQRVFLEGTQGTGLSLHHGCFPHVTSRDTTVSGCLAEAGIAPSRVRKIIMVCRTYPIRVQDPDGGTSGPMGVDTSWKVVSGRSGVPLADLLKTEMTSTTNRKRRVAEFDWTLLRKAASLNGPTDIALTFSDYIDARNREARRFDQLSEETIRFIEEVERVAGAPVTLISTRFHSRSIIDRRAW